MGVLLVPTGWLGCRATRGRIGRVESRGADFGMSSAERRRLKLRACGWVSGGEEEDGQGRVIAPCGLEEWQESRVVSTPDLLSKDVSVQADSS